MILRVVVERRALSIRLESDRARVAPDARHVAGKQPHTIANKRSADLEHGLPERVIVRRADDGFRLRLVAWIQPQFRTFLSLQLVGIEIHAAAAAPRVAAGLRDCADSST